VPFLRQERSEDEMTQKKKDHVHKPGDDAVFSKNIGRRERGLHRKKSEKGGGEKKSGRGGKTSAGRRRKLVA